jgi:hypothetical protein
MDFVNIIQKIIDQNVRFSMCFGVVTATFNSPPRVSVKLSGSTTAVTDVKYIHSYSPQVNDVVICLVNKGDVVILGNLAL